ncbi:MAG: endonuclease III [Nanoarchaeota archaeon]|nr:endonuclease III [Nanoarchaeota archaeon]
MKHFPIDKVFTVLKRETATYKVPIVDLIAVQTSDPAKVLIATILSARTKDETTSAACKRLFVLVKTVADLRKVTLRRLEKLIYPVGFYKTKARHLKMLPVVLDSKFDGVIPSTVDELIELPGVGRKTANLVVAVGFKKPGMCVDVHVHRISNRLGYISTKNPLQSEMALRDKLPMRMWEEYNRMLVAFGQHLCRPTSPWCSKCPVSKYCDRVGVGRSR